VHDIGAVLPPGVFAIAAAMPSWSLKIADPASFTALIVTFRPSAYGSGGLGCLSNFRD